MSRYIIAMPLVARACSGGMAKRAASVGGIVEYRVAFGRALSRGIPEGGIASREEAQIQLRPIDNRTGIPVLCLSSILRHSMLH